MVDVVHCELNNGDWCAVSWIDEHIAIEGSYVTLPALGFFPLLKGEFQITKVYPSPCLPVEWFQHKKEKKKKEK